MHPRTPNDIIKQLVFGLLLFFGWMGLDEYLKSFQLLKEVKDFDHPVLFLHHLEIPLLFLLLLIFTVFGEAGKSFIYANKTFKWGIRVLVLFVGWNLCFYEYNYFLDRWHWADRLLLLGSLLLAWRHPLFLLPFLGELMLLNAQFQIPLGGAPFLDKRLPVEILKLSTVFVFYIHFLNQSYEGIKDRLQLDKVWFFLALCIYGAFYFHSGWAKIEMSPEFTAWPNENEVMHNIVAMHERGWLQSYPRLHSIISGFYYFFGIPGQWLILLTELVGILILWHRKIFRIFLMAMLLLHLSVFLMNGANFLPWILSGIWLWFLAKDDLSMSRFRWYFSAASVLLIWFLPQWIFVPKLAWYDGPLDARFEIMQEDDGKMHHVNARMFAPYHPVFVLGTMRQVVKSPGVGVGFLQVEYKHYAGLKKAGLSGVQDYIAAQGYVAYQEEAHQQLVTFLEAFKKNGKKHREANTWLRRFQLPGYLNAYKTARFKDYDPEKPIELWYRHYFWTEDTGVEFIQEERVYSYLNQAR